MVEQKFINNSYNLQEEWELQGLFFHLKKNISSLARGVARNNRLVSQIFTANY